MIKDPRMEKNRVIDPGHIGRQVMAFRTREAKRVIKVSPRVVEVLSCGRVLSVEMRP